MDNRTKGIIGTVATALLCGCPGLLLCFIGATTALGSGTFDLSDFGMGTGATPPAFGLAFMCAALILIAIPVVVGFLTLRKKPAPADLSTPTPPAS